MEDLVMVGFGVVGVTQVIKMLGMPHKFLPLVAALLGIGLALAVMSFTVESGILGLVEGLTVTGFVNFAKEIKKAPVVNVSVPTPPAAPQN